MGKKAKIGKARRDKFYQLAKETGYRSRAAFKLLQLNRKYEFLQKSRVCIDLCAAPGGWLQVAKKHMPVSSVVIGIDQVPIKAIHNVVTIQEDITDVKCRLRLKKELQSWKADLVLHDGAPNVGKNWLQDAFLQAQLTLSALKLATEFLVKGGWFVTKVFRSKDYHALLWILHQLFKKVYATKPQASRLESAEIFVVCQHYLAPDKIDPKFLDPAFAFADVTPEPQIAKLNLSRPEKKHKKAEGYAEGDYTLYHRRNVSEFIRQMNYIEMLNDCSELVFDDESFASHPLTTAEIRECCRDIKVLGRKELKLLLLWRKHLRNTLGLNMKEEKVEEIVVEETEEEKIQKEIDALKLKEVRDIRLKKKKVLKDRRKLRDKMNLKMILPNDEPTVEQDATLFKMSTICNQPQLKAVEEYRDDSEPEQTDDDDENKPPRYVSYDKSEPVDDGDEGGGGGGVKNDPYEMEIESEDEAGIGGLGPDDTASDNDDDDEDEDEASDDEFANEASQERNPLLVDLDYSTPTEKTQRKMDIWFAKDSFAGVGSDNDEDLELELVAQNAKKNDSLKQSEERTSKLNGPHFENGDDAKARKRKIHQVDDDDDNDDDSDDDDSESDYDVEAGFSSSNVSKTSANDTKQSAKNAKKSGFEVVQAQKIAKKRMRKMLDPEGLALGSLMIKSNKTKRDILDLAWNRYTNNDEDLPDWFIEHERKHYRPNLPVTKAMVAEYRDRLKEINARPIKKVVEAKTRKRRRAVRKMDRARKRAENVVANLDMNEGEKAHQIKTIYKKAGVLGEKKKEVKYIVSKKGLAGKRVRRPKGLKGRFRVVDPRQKKDDHRRKTMEKEAKRRKLPKSKVTQLKKRLATMNTGRQLKLRKIREKKATG